MKKKDYHKPGYWKDWYWNKGGREKVQATRYIAEYEREKRRARTSVAYRTGAKVSRKAAGWNPVVSTINNLLILNIINMVKLKRLTVDKIDPSVNQKGQIEFSFNDCYLCKNQIGGIIIINNEPSITSNWVQKEVLNYCISNNLQVCTIHTIGNMPDYSNIVVDETVKELLKSL